MRNALGLGAAASRLFAGLLLVSIAGIAPAACGGSKSNAASAESAPLPPDVATVSIFVVKSGSSDSYSVNAAAAVSEQLTRAGYKVVDNEKSAEAFARLDVNKTREESIVQIQVGGKTLESYKVTLNLDLVDRDGTAIDKVSGEYSSDDEKADPDAVAAMVNKLSGSARLAAYAKSTKEARAARQKKEQEERKTAEAEEKDRAEKEAQAKQDQAARTRAEGSLRTADNLKRDIDAVRKNGAEAIPNDKLVALEKAIEALKKDAPDSAAYYSYYHTQYTIENAWWQSEADAPKTIGTTLASDIVTSGASDGKKLNVTFNAKAGHCYTAIMRYKTTTGREEINKIEWAARAGNSNLQRYYYTRHSDEPDVQRMAGTCVTKDTPVTLTADLVFAGTKNALRYAVVGSPKTKFPVHLATYSSISVGDKCDYDAWYQLWADPIPGSLVYDGTEPFLVASPDRAGGTWVTLYNATLGDVRSQKKELATEPPKAVKFSTQFKFPGCNRDSAEHADSIRFQKCHAQIDAKYKGQWEAAERARDNALTYLARRAAEAQLKRLDEADDNDREKLCKPIEEQIAKKFEATFNKIVDRYTESPVKSPIDRAAAMHSQSRR
jgi:hypothetical protein